MQKHCIKSSSDIYFGYLLEWPQRGDSNKYPKHMFCEPIRIKQGLSYIVFCPLRILYNSKFIIMATFLGTNAVVVTGIHCTRVLQKVLSLGSDYVSATVYQTQFYYKPSKYYPFTETHFCNHFTQSRNADK